MKRILYVDRDLTDRFSRQFVAALAKLGEISTVEWLTSEVPEMVKRARAQVPFDAVVSHLPPARRFADGESVAAGGLSFIGAKIAIYGPAFDLLQKVKRAADIPVVVYTGACREHIPPAKWDESGVDEIVEKTRDPEEDARRVATILRDAWALYASLPPRADFEFERSDEALTCDVVVRINGGVGLYVLGRFWRLLGPYEEGFVLTPIGAGGKPDVARECRSFLDCLGLPLDCGRKVRLRIAPPDEGAVETLRRLHRLLNSRYWWEAEPAETDPAGR
ncbi:MAG: hypothetical protein N2652_04865 [Kiritimatiellae bacterium]|nr:hypothetical protein [Kiritimatiellia bacterium]